MVCPKNMYAIQIQTTLNVFNRLFRMISQNSGNSKKLNFIQLTFSIGTLVEAAVENRYFYFLDV